MKTRLDHAMVKRGLSTTRSQAENYIKLGYVLVDGRAVTKPGAAVNEDSLINLTIDEQYVSRAALKLASVADKMGLDFRGKTVLDVGSSTGGFTDYALKHGASKIIAVDVGSHQLHPRLRDNSSIELHENTDIRNLESLSTKPDIVLIDTSFISLREVIPAVSRLVSKQAWIVAMCKPQFESGDTDKHKGIIKNDTMRRRILKDFEAWARRQFVILDKADSEITGAKGNRERFYLLQKSS